MNDVEIDVGARDDAVLVCTTDQALRSDVASVLRRRYPVRTADSEPDALDSLDDHVSVLVLDLTDRAFSIDPFAAARVDGTRRFQLAVVVEESPSSALRERCDGVVRKPVDGRELAATVHWLHRRGQYDKLLGAYYALADEYAALTTDPEADPGAVRAVEDQLGQVRDAVDDVADGLDELDALQVALSDPDAVVVEFEDAFDDR